MNDASIAEPPDIRVIAPIVHSVLFGGLDTSLKITDEFKKAQSGCLGCIKLPEHDLDLLYKVHNLHGMRIRELRKKLSLRQFERLIRENEGENENILPSLSEYISSYAEEKLQLAMLRIEKIALLGVPVHCDKERGYLVFNTSYQEAFGFDFVPEDEIQQPGITVMIGVQEKNHIPNLATVKRSITSLASLQ